MAYTLGIDIGSAFSKAVVCRDRVLMSCAIIPSGGNYKETAGSVAEMVLEQVGLVQGDISYTVATGYGAAMVDFAEQSITDISCHAVGVFHLFPSVRTLIDIGAQFSKAIRLNDTGKVANFVLNEKCAGGSGKFIQVIARILHMNIEDIGEISLKSLNPVEFTTGCAVFAESEAVSRIAEGALPEDILAGVHKAMASKIGNLVVRLGLVGNCLITGGGAKDSGLVREIETEIKTDILVPIEPRITAALGAALLAAEQCLSLTR
jgi:(R)-2-hydroxyacyl-CoA dehydratese activating ATPase